MPNQRVFSKIAVIIIIFILIGGVYFVFSKKKNNIPSQDTEKNNSQSSQAIGGDLSMNEWKTYKNDQYGFEIKFPENWLLKDTEVNKFDYKVIEFIEPVNKYALLIGILKIKNNPSFINGNKSDYVSFVTDFGDMWRSKNPRYDEPLYNFYYFELKMRKVSKAQDYDSVFSNLINNNFYYIIRYRLPENFRIEKGSIVDLKTIEIMDEIIKTLKFNK